MNILFLGLILLSSVYLIFTAPEKLLPALLSGGQKAASLCVALLPSYALWMGIMEIWKDTGLTKHLAKLLNSPVKKLFKVEKSETVEAVSLNIASNLIGIGALATPYGIQAAKLIEHEKHPEFSSAMLLIFGASSLQLIPTSVIAMRVSFLSQNPSDIVLPTFLISLCSLTLSVLFCNLLIKKDGSPYAVRKRVPV